MVQLPPSGSVPPDYLALAQSGLFEADWYRVTYQAELPHGADPLMDFCIAGWHAGRRPNPYFDCTWYLAQNTDVAETNLNPLAHYLLDGEQEGRRPIGFFDPVWYRTEQLISTGETCLAHFLARRLTGRVRPVPNFDPARHFRKHPELIGAGADPYLHAQSAEPEPSERDIILASGLFDPNFYLLTSPDVRASGLDPLDHFCTHGWRENRNPNAYFNTPWYLSRLPKGNETVGNPLIHYFLKGELQGQKPIFCFDPCWYSATYTLHPWQSALSHYLAERRSQRYSPNSDFDVAAYLATFGTQIGRNRDPFMHFLRYHPQARDNGA